MRYAQGRSALALNKTTKSLTTTALFAIIIAVCSWIAIPIGSVPITLQTFAVALAGFLLGKKKGAVCAVLYLLMGAIGLPVFASMQGGIGPFLAPTGGFLIGFIPLAFFCGFNKTKSSAFLFGTLGLLVLHTVGIVYMCLISHVDPFATFLTVSLPFSLKDALCLFAAYIIASRIKKEF